MNLVMMIGRLTKDPELKYLAGDGKAVANFTLAVNREYKNDEADFFRVNVWGKQAENVANYMSKGRMVGIRGSLTSRSYDDKNGNRQYITEIIANSVQFLDKANEGNTNQANYSNKSSGASSPATSEYDFDGIQSIDDDDVPF